MNIVSAVTGGNLHVSDAFVGVVFHFTDNLFYSFAYRQYAVSGFDGQLSAIGRLIQAVYKQQLLALEGFIYVVPVERTVGDVERIVCLAALVDEHEAHLSAEDAVARSHAGRQTEVVARVLGHGVGLAVLPYELYVVLAFVAHERTLVVWCPVFEYVDVLAVGVVGPVGACRSVLSGKGSHQQRERESQCS